MRNSLASVQKSTSLDVLLNDSSYRPHAVFVLHDFYCENLLTESVLLFLMQNISSGLTKKSLIIGQTCSWWPVDWCGVAGTYYLLPIII